MYIHPYVLEQLSQRYKADMLEQARGSRRQGHDSTAGTAFAGRRWSIRATSVRRWYRQHTGSRQVRSPLDAIARRADAGAGIGQGPTG
jgi:hypothetical protein